MRDIFISYVEEDNPITTQLAEGLEAAGYSVWYYERDGAPGASYLLQTRDAIEGCQAVILILSPDSVTSEQVTLEVVRAHESNKKFLPLRTNISHAEFVERRPEWAQALGASTSIAISVEDASSVVPRLLIGLRKMNIAPRPDLVTNEMAVITPEMIRDATSERKERPTQPAPTPRPTTNAFQDAKTSSNKKLDQAVEGRTKDKADAHDPEPIPSKLARLFRRKGVVIAAALLALILATAILASSGGPTLDSSKKANYQDESPWVPSQVGWKVGSIAVPETEDSPGIPKKGHLIKGDQIGLLGKSGVEDEYGDAAPYGGVGFYPRNGMEFLLLHLVVDPITTKASEQ